jgi:hypothetical protein
MRRSVLSSLVLALLLTLAGGSRDRDGEDSSADPGDTDALPARPAVLVYYGHGGVGPEGLGGSMTHLDDVALLEEASLRVDYTTAWPASFDAYRLAILPGPGANDVAVEFSAAERGLLRGVATAGGVVVVEAEAGNVMNLGPLNDLVWDLGTKMVVEGVSVAGDTDGIGDHPLTDGVVSLGLDGATRVDPGDGACLATVGFDCVAAATAAGDGWIVVLGDGDLLSRLLSFTDEGHDNDLFLRRLAHLRAE